MKNRIAVDPKIHFGKPCVAGTRIPVQDVLELVQEPSTVIAVHAELESVLSRYTEEQLRKAFVVVEPGRHRFRQAPE